MVSLLSVVSLKIRVPIQLVSVPRSPLSVVSDVDRTRIRLKNGSKSKNLCGNW